MSSRVVENTKDRVYYPCVTSQHCNIYEFRSGNLVISSEGKAIYGGFPSYEAERSRKYFKEFKSLTWLRMLEVRILRQDQVLHNT